MDSYAQKKIWYHVCGAREWLDTSILENALLEAGFAVSEEEEIKGGIGCVFFTEPNQELLNQLSHQSKGRVLAIGNGDASLTHKDMWHILKAGASDVIQWEGFERSFPHVSSRLERWMQVDMLMHSPLVQGTLVGTSSTWKKILRQVIEVARFTQASALIMGESGTGKELVARLIHDLDTRKDKQRLVLLDCTTIVPELSGSEFFGHEKGAFTGASSQRDGAFSLADHGTLFLDEIGELPLMLQAELLRVIQEGNYKRVGSHSWKETHFRLVCATNRDLLLEQDEHRFRSDLYYRIATWTLKLPPLSERKEDILPLAHHFLKQMYPDQDIPELSSCIREYLMCRDYKGNIRELRHLVRQLAWRHEGKGPITVGHVPLQARPHETWMQDDWKNGKLEGAIRLALSQGIDLKEISKTAADTAVRLAIEEADGNLKRAAQRLGVTDRALQLRRAGKTN